MGLLCDYFVAPSDEAAAATLDDGPQGLPTVSGEGIEPAVKIGTLEELLTGKPFDDILADSDELVAVRDEGARIVSRLRHS